jgi:hypothetical protein
MTTQLQHRPRPATPRAPLTIADLDVPDWSTEADIGIRPTPARNLPRAAVASRTFAAALLDIMTGRRADRQLRPHCAPTVFGGLQTLTAAMPDEPGTVLRLHITEPADGVAEVSASFRRDARVAALAFRLQGIDGRWRLTDLQVG